LPEAIVLSARFDYISWIHTGFLALDKPFVFPSSFSNYLTLKIAVIMTGTITVLTIAKLMALCN
jgi:hypothetical protein